jgi:hypothetical protein
MTFRPRFSRLTVGALIWVSLWAIAGVAMFRRMSIATTELSRATSFQLGGLTGPSGDALHLQWLLHVPGAEGRFSELVAEGSPAGKIFGACGLQVIGSDRFEAARKQVAKDDSEVLVILGCLGSSTPVREVDLPQLCPHVRVGGLQWAMAEIDRILER